MKKKYFLMTVAIIFIAINLYAQDTGTFIDSRDDKIYKTIKIGTQTWMAENLNYKTNNNWCYDNNNSYCNIYGRLYTWEAAKNNCPSGWYLPTYNEWSILIAFLGGDLSGGKLASTSKWLNPKINATNSSGFSALPGGVRTSDKFFNHLGLYGYFWSSSSYDTDNAWYINIGYDYGYISKDNFYKDSGFSVRCIKNN